VTLEREGADQSATGTPSDLAGNSASTTITQDQHRQDRAASSASSAAPRTAAATSSAAFRSAPTCSASDALSGVDGTCSVAGYSNLVGTHTVTTTVTDQAGNTSTASSTYTVLAWTLGGFFQPVDMGGVVNTVKAGSTVPLKFTVLAGSTPRPPSTP
jgi:predicted phage gp36 major capsid-like protein